MMGRPLLDALSAVRPEGWRRRIRFDLALLILFYVVMMDRLTENPVHEALGVLVGLPVLLHAALNGDADARALGLRRRRRPASWSTRVKRALTLLFTISFLCACATGLAASQTRFAQWTPEAWRMELGMRTLHVGFSVLFWLLAAVHAGLHAAPLAGALFGRIPGAAAAACRSGVVPALEFILVLLGLRRFFAREFDLMLAL